MTTKVSDSPEHLDISSWLAELHMECYKKHLEDYETIKPLLDLRESDIKKLGVSNSKDRSRMMNSLAGYKGLRKQESVTPVTGSQVAQIQEAHKSILRKSSLKKLNIKSLLTSGSSKKNKNSKKNSAEGQQISDLSLSIRSTVDSTEDSRTMVTPTPSSVGHSVLPPPPSLSMQKPGSSMLADYEELPDIDAVAPITRSMTMDPKPFQVSRQPAVENEYVPSPENSPKFSSQRLRANTSVASLNPEFPSLSHRGPLAGVYQHSQHSTPELLMRQQQHEYGSTSTEDDSPSLLTHKHLSVVSMESGLSFGYDVEKDFNPSQPLESQPWFHGKVTRTDAEALLHDDGDFIVRENTTMSNTYTLTLRWRGVADHTLIGTTEVISSSFRGSAVKYQFDSGAFDSIPELIFNHLKYQIPIDKAQHTLIINPVCRSGNSTKGGMFGGYATAFSHRSNLSPESSPAYSGGNARRSGSPLEVPRHYPIRLGKSLSVSTRGSATPPSERLSKHLSSSSGDLLEASSKEDFTPSPRNVISPPPDTGGRSMSHISSLRQSGSSIGSGVSHPGSQGPTEEVPTSIHQRVDSFGDYEVMESVSILNGSPSLGTRMPHPPVQPEGHRYLQPFEKQDLAPQKTQDYARALSLSAPSNSLQLPRGDRDRVKYAEIRYPRDGGPGVIINSKKSSVNYAEVRFPRSNTVSTPSQASQPYALYDIVPPGRREATPPKQEETRPYQSRADVLAQRLQGEPTYSVPNPARRLHFSAHPVSNYATIQFPTSSTHGHTSNSTQSYSNTLGKLSSTPDSTVPGSQSTAAQVPIKQTDATLYALPKKPHKVKKLGAKVKDSSSSSAREPSPKPQDLGALSSSNDSLLSSASDRNSTNSIPKHVMGASLVHSHSTSAKVHKDLPGYEALVKVHTILQNNSNEELAYHMTRTDAMSFMLAPRPAEDKSIWKERVKQATSSSGMFCGLQTLADPDGEKLWKKLYFRHLNLSQTVTLTIVTAGDALERAKLLHRYIEVAELLQSKYGNLFSFISIMQGLSTPQLNEMSEVWELMKTHFSEGAATYKTLQAIVTSIDQGDMVPPPKELTIPPIQQLKSVFHFTEQNMVGFLPVHLDHSIVGEFTSLAAGHAALRTIVANTANFTQNAWRKLEGLQYNVNLMEFFMQDFTRVYLQSINVHSDSPLERRRRFGLLMDALIDRVESSETV